MRVTSIFSTSPLRQNRRDADNPEKLKADSLRGSPLRGTKPGRVRGKGAIPEIKATATAPVNDTNQVIEVPSPCENILILIPASEDAGDLRAAVPALTAKQAGGARKRAPHEQAVLEKMLFLAKAAFTPQSDPALAFYKKRLPRERV